MVFISPRTSLSDDPFSGKIQGKIIPTDTTFMMLYYLPSGQSNSSVRSCGSTYYLAWQYEDNMATFGVLNYQSSNRGAPLAFRYKINTNGFSFGGQTILNYTGTNAQLNNKFYQFIAKEIPNIPGGATVESNEITDTSLLYNGTSVDLEQINTNLATTEIYAGVWYYMKYNGSYITPPTWDLPPGVELGSFPFPGVDTTTLNLTNGNYLETPWVMFLPYTNSLTYYTGGVCQSSSWNFGMQLTNDWIMTKFSQIHNNDYVSTFAQKQCYGNLGPNSKYCVFIGSSCNGNLGYNYARKGIYCGKSFGACRDPALKCTWDSNNSHDTFYCSSASMGTGPDRDPDASQQHRNSGRNKTKENSHWTLTIIAMIFAITLLIIVIFYIIGHAESLKKHSKHLTKHHPAVGLGI